MAIKWVLDDDCLVPASTIRIDFKGTNPFRFYRDIRTVLREVLEIRGKDIWERDFRWDFAVEPRKFFVKVAAKKSFDNWTAAYFELTFQGTQPSDLIKEGEMVIFVYSKLRTEAPNDTIWQKSSMYKGMRWLYFRTFYNDARRILLNKCIGETNRIIERLQAVLHIIPPRTV